MPSPNIKSISSFAGLVGMGLCMMSCASSSGEGAQSLRSDGTSVAGLGALKSEPPVTQMAVGFISTETRSAMRTLSDRLLVRSFTFSPQMRLNGVTLHLPSDSPRWEGSGVKLLSEIRVGQGGRLVSWTESEGPDDCQLHARIVNGQTVLECSGVCPPEYPICTLHVVVIEEVTHIVCICNAES